jgi:cell wall assembly regulator SMI1
MPDVTNLLHQLDQWLRKHRRRYVKGLCPGASPEQLQCLPPKSPQSLRDLLAWHNGQVDGFAGKFEQDWLLMSAEQIAQTKLYLDDQADEDPTLGWYKAWIPFLDNDQGDYMCVDVSRSTTPVRIFLAGQKKHPAVARSLVAWLADYVHAVTAGQYVEDSERGTYLRKG